MDQVEDFFLKLLNTNDWPPRWHCGHWTEFHGWLYIVSDLLIWSAYFIIPVLILRYVSKNVDSKFLKIYFLFAAFILACGSTHLLDAIMFWFPVYRLSALVRFMTGVISWITVFNLIKLLPKAFSLKSPEQLEREVEQRKIAEENLLIKNYQLNEAQEISKIGHWEWEVSSNKINWSNSLFKIYGQDPNQGALSFEAFLKCIHPDDREYVDGMIKSAFQQGKFSEYFHRIVLPTGEVKICHARGEVIVDNKQQVVKMIGTSQDVTEQKTAQRELIQKTKELELINGELQKFAYIASHDLQEPLRKIITFISLLEEEYKNETEIKGKKYIDKISNAAERMQNLIHDVLLFSRLSSTPEDMTLVDLNTVVNQVLSDMEIAIQESSVKITVEKLPEINGHETQMVQLFQNLISNAIKFRSIDRPLHIRLSCELATEKSKFSGEVFDKGKPGNLDQIFLIKESVYRISITDNGIGFEEQYKDRIFEVFQRLHSQSTFKGTGIGLAICKKIVENHHGTISVSSLVNEGTTFVVTLPTLKRDNNLI